METFTPNRPLPGRNQPDISVDGSHPHGLLPAPLPPIQPPEIDGIHSIAYRPGEQTVDVNGIPIDARLIQLKLLGAHLDHLPTNAIGGKDRRYILFSTSGGSDIFLVCTRKQVRRLYQLLVMGSLPPEASLLHRVTTVLPETAVPQDERTYPSWSAASYARTPVDPVFYETYLRHIGRATQYIVQNLDGAVTDPDFWRNHFLPAVHEICMRGGTGSAADHQNNHYGGVCGASESFQRTREFRDNHAYMQLDESVLKLITMWAKQLQDPFALHQSDSAYTVPGTPIHVPASKMIFILKDTVFIEQSMETMRLEYRQAIGETDPLEAKQHIARAYQAGIRAHPYWTVNNSWLMTLANTALDSKGLKTLPHFDLDMFAYVCTPDTFEKVFEWYHDNFAEDYHDPAQRNEARRKTEAFHNWLRDQSYLLDENTPLPDIPQKLGLTPLPKK